MDNSDNPRGPGEKFKQVADVLFEGQLGKLADALGMKPGSFSKYTTGKTYPGWKILIRLRQLGISLNWFLSDIPPMLLNDLDRNSELTAIEKQGLEEVQKRIKWVRVYYKKTIPEMASLLRVSTNTQVDIEKGDKEPWPDYLGRVLEQFEDVRREWLIENKEPKLSSYPVREKVRQTGMEAEPGPGLYNSLESADLTPVEIEILVEVKEFSEFLRTRPLPVRVKRILIQRLIESIDQAIEQLHDTDNPDDQA